MHTPTLLSLYQSYLCFLESCVDGVRYTIRELAYLKWMFRLWGFVSFLIYDIFKFSLTFVSLKFCFIISCR